jgi:nuclear transport factor 2 (NTF2) superfamily protein
MRTVSQVPLLLRQPAALQFLRRKWAREQGYRLRKYLWTYQDNRIAVCFEYEYHDAR